MENYIIIVLATVCFAAQFAFTKLFEQSIAQNRTATLVMMSVTGIIGTLIFLAANGFSVAISPISAIWAVVFALVMIPYYMIGIKALSLGSLAVYSMFMMLGGMLLPFFYGVLFLKEAPSAAQIVGTVLLTICIIMQAVFQNDGMIKNKNGKKVNRCIFFVLCLSIFFLNGMTGVIAKAHEISPDTVDEKSFTVIYCLLISVMSLVILGISFLKDRSAKLAIIKNSVKLRPLAIMAMIGAAAYGGNFLQLLAADTVPASVQFPLVSGGVIVLSALVSAFAFKEKISKKEWLSIAGAFISTVLFAF